MIKSTHLLFPTDHMDEERVRARIRAHLALIYPRGVPSGAEPKLEGALSERAGGDFFDGYYAASSGSLGRPVYSKLRADGTFFSDGGAEISWEDGDWAIRSKSGTEGCCEYFSGAISKWLARVPPTNGWEGVTLTHLEFDWLDLEPVKESTQLATQQRIAHVGTYVGTRIDGLCLD